MSARLDTRRPFDTRRWFATRRQRRVTRLGHLRACLPASALTGLLGGLVGLPTGAGQALGVLLGAAVAAAVLTLGALAVDAADRLATHLVLPIGLGTYLATIVALGGVILRFQDSTGPVVTGLPWGVVAVTVLWLFVQSWWAWTSPTPYVVLPPDHPAQ